MTSSIFLAELLGTMLLIFIGTSTVASVALKKSGAYNSGWVFITIGWGMAVLIGANFSGPISGGHLNPAVSLAMFFFDPSFTFSMFLFYVVAQVIGAMLGAILTMVLFADHFADEESGDMVTVFSTAPTYDNMARNIFSEMIGTFVLISTIYATTLYDTAMPFVVPMAVVGIGISIGSVTGYAINPARDFGPRLAFQLFFRHKNKGSANWSYALVPIIGPLIGSALAYVVFTIMIGQ